MTPLAQANKFTDLNIRARDITEFLRLSVYEMETLSTYGLSISKVNTSEIWNCQKNTRNVTSAI